MMFEQSPLTRKLGGVLYFYEAPNRPVWYLLVPSAWTNNALTQNRLEIRRTTGTPYDRPYSAPDFSSKNRRVAQLRRESATLAHRVVEKCSGIDRRAGPAGEAVMSAPIVERHPVLPLSAACAALRASRAASHRRRRALVAWRPRPSAVSAWALGADELATVVTLHSLRLVDEPPREIVGCLPAEDTPTCQVPGMGGIERVLAGDYSRLSPATPRRRSHHRRLHRCPTRSFLKSHGSSPAWAQLGGFTRSASKPRAKASARGSSCGQPRGQES